MNGYITARNWSAKLLLVIPQGITIPGLILPPPGLTDFGYWNRDAAQFGAEAGDITDPEDGKVIIGGRQTAENLTINRPWKASRDRSVYQVVRALRGRISGRLILHELDEFDQPVSSSPLDVLEVIPISVRAPQSDAASSDSSVIEIDVQVQA